MQNHTENNGEFRSLKVNAGISDVPSINPDLKKHRVKRKSMLDVEEYFEGILSGNVAILGQAVTLIESALPKHQKVAQQLIERCLPHTKQSIRIGITGVPGAGKSTFIESLGMQLISQGHKLAVLAIDPSSERTQGSILGDKTRMFSLSTSENAFIRPSPSAGSLGGVARKTRESIILCEAAGFDTIFIETVGVGQSETAVHSMVDFFLLLQIAGAGDELQGIKRGIMEMADGLVINKADGNNIHRAELAQAELRNALHLFPMPESGWTPQVLTCSAIEKNGIAAVWDMIQSYLEFTQKNTYFATRRTLQSKYWMFSTISEQLQAHFFNNREIKEMIKLKEKLVIENKMSSFVAAKELLETYFKLHF